MKESPSTPKSSRNVDWWNSAPFTTGVSKSPLMGRRVPLSFSEGMMCMLPMEPIGTSISGGMNPPTICPSIAMPSSSKLTGAAVSSHW